MAESETSTFDFNAALDVVEGIGPDDVGDGPAAEYSDFSKKEFSQRYRRLQALMQQSEMTAVLATQEENVRYFTGYQSVLWVSRFRPAIAILPAELTAPAGLVVSGQERGNVEATSWVGDIFAFSPQEAPMPGLAAELARRGLDKGRVGIEWGFGQRLGMSQEQLGQLRCLLPDVHFVDATPLMQAVRMVKSCGEVERIAKACELSAAGIIAGWRCLRVGMTERELLAVMAGEMYRLGAEVGTQPSMFGIRAGRRWHLSNPVASEYRLRDGDLVNVDGGATYRGYVCDFMRQACCGAPTEAQREWLDIAIAANDAAVAAVAPGVTAHAVYDAALGCLEELGRVQYNRMTIVGHGLGADIHELPWLGERSSVYSATTRLRQGMVLAVEPGIQPPEKEGLGGHFITEEVVVVTAEGSRVLTSHLDKALWVAR